jgi:gliding motility-associated-like protein
MKFARLKLFRMYQLIASVVFITLLTGFRFAKTENVTFSTTPIQPTTSQQVLGDTLKLNDMIFANYFSPNFDGFNDKYTILNVENWPGNSLKVFNRWGELVFQAEPYLNDWDGTNNSGNAIMDKKCTDGVYFFEFYDGKGSKVNGTITLKR